jgi:hypothetical protein
VNYYYYYWTKRTKQRKTKILTPTRTASNF